MKKMIIPTLALLAVLGVSPANAEDVNAKVQELQKALALNPDDAKLLNDTGVALYKAGKYAEAEPLLQRSLEISEKTLGKEHPDVAKSLNDLGDFYYSQHIYELAEPLYKRSLEIRERKLSKDHPDVAESLNNLANIYSEQDNKEQKK